ncbi:MAG: AAA family ATPase [Alphaproteobacteria bacterium]|nr:AAA family ATPase [Alphaproteobacteria bacterium]
MKHASVTQAARQAGTSAAPKLIAFLTDSQTADTLQQVALERRIDGAVIYEGGISAALEEITSMSLPDLLIVDVGDSPTAVTDVSALATACRKSSKLIVIGEVNDVHLFRDLLGAGASDYLVKPVNRYQLLAAVLESGPQQVQQKTAERLGQLVVCIGARGGVGTTTTAVGLAWMIAQERAQKVALVDLDLQFGTVALSFNVGAGRGLREALEQPARIDSLFIERATEKVSDNLFVLGSEEPLEDDLAIDLAAPSLLLHELRERFDWVVVDMPRGANMLHRQVLAEATRVVVLAEMTLPGIRDAIRLNALVHDCAPGADAFFVTLDRGNAKGQRIGPKDFEKSVGRPISVSLPWDATAVQQAAAQARPVPAVSNTSKLSHGYHELLDKVAGENAAAKGKFWKKLLGK